MMERMNMMKIISEKEFRTQYLEAVRSRATSQIDDIIEDVRAILRGVRDKGDQGVKEYTEKFDGVKLDALKVTEEEIQRAYESVDQEFINAIKAAKDNIEAFHDATLPWAIAVDTVPGVTVGHVFRPIEAVGLYVPGGSAPYPSSVLMGAVPAQLAKVPKRILCTPPDENGMVNPHILVAASESEVSAIFKVGGAQAIAALAYGTETVPRVQKIIGPGNRYVTAAKLLVQLEVGIDLPAGPSEVLILADDTSNPKFLAMDLLAQAEHDPNAFCFLLSTSKKVASSTLQLLENRFDQFERREIIQQVLENNLYIVVTENLENAIELSNEIAPEHLEIQTKDPGNVLTNIKNAGAVFLGPYSPVAVGDYSAGSNHVLPTGGTAKFYSGLNIYDFLKTIEVVECTNDGLENLKKTTVVIAEKEGLTAHAKSVTERFMK